MILQSLAQITELIKVKLYGCLTIISKLCIAAVFAQNLTSFKCDTDGYDGNEFDAVIIQRHFFFMLHFINILDLKL